MQDSTLHKWIVKLKRSRRVRVPLLLCVAFILGNKTFSSTDKTPVSSEFSFPPGNHVYVEENSITSKNLFRPERIFTKRVRELGFQVHKKNGIYVDFVGGHGRDIIGDVVESLKLEIGVEVGVQAGNFAAEILRKWKSCRKYVLVDIWSTQQNYAYALNQNDEVQEKMKKSAIANVRQWQEKIEICHNYSEVCSTRFENSFFDYAYLDARHDFKAVLEDLEAWYAKVRKGGIIAGHDYTDSVEVVLQSGRQWIYQDDGSVDNSLQAVRGAVNLFFALKEQYITWPDWQRNLYKSWVVLKSDNSRANNIFHFIDLSCLDRPNGKEKKLDMHLALKVTKWMKNNVRFSSIVWTCSLTKMVFPDLIPKYWASYQGRTSLFEDFVKLHILEKLGGVFVNFKLPVLPGLEKFAEKGLESRTAYAFCAYGKKHNSMGTLTENCSRISTLMIGSRKHGSGLKKMAALHHQIFRSRKYAKDVHSAVILSDVLRASDLTVFRLNQPFSADACDSLPYTEDCVASEREAI